MIRHRYSETKLEIRFLVLMCTFHWKTSFRMMRPESLECLIILGPNSPLILHNSMPSSQMRCKRNGWRWAKETRRQAQAQARARDLALAGAFNDFLGTSKVWGPQFCHPSCAMGVDKVENGARYMAFLYEVLFQHFLPNLLFRDALRYFGILSMATKISRYAIVS